MEGVSFKEKELVRQAREGDIQAFALLVEKYQQRAIHIANSFVGNFEDARDAAQEAFVKAYEHLNDFEEHSRFYTWFYRIVVNTCKDFLRKKKFRDHFSLWFGNEKGDLAIALDLPDRAKNAGEELANREIGLELKRSMEKLSLRQRSVFTLRYLEGLKLEEISETLGLSMGTVKAHLWQATNKMRSMLYDLWEDGQND